MALHTKQRSTQWPLLSHTVHAVLPVVLRGELGVLVVVVAALVAEADGVPGELPVRPEREVLRFELAVSNLRGVGIVRAFAVLVEIARRGDVDTQRLQALRLVDLA